MAGESVSPPVHISFGSICRRPARDSLASRTAALGYVVKTVGACSWSSATRRSMGCRKETLERLADRIGFQKAQALNGYGAGEVPTSGADEYDTLGHHPRIEDAPQRPQVGLAQRLERVIDSHRRRVLNENSRFAAGAGTFPDDVAIEKRHPNVGRLDNEPAQCIETDRRVSAPLVEVAHQFGLAHDRHVLQA